MNSTTHRSDRANVNVQRRPLPSRQQLSPTHGVNLLPGATTDECYQPLDHAAAVIPSDQKIHCSSEDRHSPPGMGKGHQQAQAPEACSLQFPPQTVPNSLSSPTMGTHLLPGDTKPEKEFENRSKQEVLSKEW